MTARATAGPSTAELLGMRRGELMDAMRAGHPIDAGALDDREYHGISPGLPNSLERLSWKKLGKVFHRDPDSGELRGWNVRLAQNDTAMGAEAARWPPQRSPGPEWTRR